MLKRKILIVDDDSTLAAEVKLTLEETGRFEAQCESKGSRALETALAFSPDLILMDLLIPDLPGAEAAEQLHDHPATRHIPIVFFTILVSRDEVQANTGMIGGRYFLAKPSTIEELVRCIDQALAYRESRYAA